MAGDTLDSDSTMVRHLAIEHSASEELASRTPLSPVTRNVPVAGSPSKIFEGTPFSRSLARGENQEDVHHRSSSAVLHQLQQAAGGAQGLSRMSPAAGYAELGGRTQHQRGASLGSFRCENEAKDILGDTDRPPARTMSLKSEDSFSQIAEEAKFLGQLLCAEVGLATSPLLDIVRGSVGSCGICLMIIVPEAGHLVTYLRRILLDRFKLPRRPTT